VQPWLVVQMMLAVLVAPHRALSKVRDSLTEAERTLIFHSEWFSVQSLRCCCCCPVGIPAFDT
jgi:hypothetical protein